MNIFILIKKKKMKIKGKEIDYIDDINNIGFSNFDAAKKYASTLKDLNDVYFCKINVIEGKYGADILLQLNNSVKSINLS